LRKGSPAIDAGLAVKNGKPDLDGPARDLGALPYGSAWIPGLDWAGQVTAFYTGQTEYRPVDIDRGLFTVHRNHVQRPSWFQTGRYGPDFQHLPGGEHSWAGVTWWIEPDNDNTQPTVLVLKGLGSESKAESITGIDVNRKADTLAFLQTYHAQPVLQKKKEPVELFAYVVHYEDGSSERIPIRWQNQIAYWQGDRQHLPDARLAWSVALENRRSNNNLRSLWKDYLRIYSFEWTNPHPDKTITTIDMVGAAPFDYGAPAVFAISTGHKQ
jgi:hypothetical protein